MAQEQKNIKNQEASSKSFDEILERMRSRVTEISSEDRVQKVLHDDDETGQKSSAADETKLAEEQTRTFVEMSKQLSQSEPVTEESVEQSVIDAAEPEAEQEWTQRKSEELGPIQSLEEDSDDAAVYQKILEALQMKDLSSLKNAQPTEIEEIVSHGAEEENAQSAQNAQSDSDQNGLEASAEVQSVIEAEPASSTEEETKISQVGADFQEQTMIAQAALSQKDGEAAEKPVDVNRALDRLAKVANSMEKTLKDKEMAAPAQETLSHQENEAEIEGTVEVGEEAETALTAEQLPAEEEHSAAKEVDDNSNEESAAVAETVAQAAMAEAAVQEVAAKQADSVSVADAAPEPAPEHAKRLDAIEETLVQIMNTQEEIDQKSIDMMKKHDDALHLMTRESQKVAEATATKLTEALAEKVSIDTNKEHTLLRSEMETVQEGLNSLSEKFTSSQEGLDNLSEKFTSSQAGLDSLNEKFTSSQAGLESLNEKFTSSQEGLHNLNEKFASSATEQNNAYEAMQQSLAMLHEKLNTIGSEVQADAVKASARPNDGGEPGLTQRIQNEILGEKASRPAQPQSKLPLSSQALRNFVNAPLLDPQDQRINESQARRGAGVGERQTENFRPLSAMPAAGVNETPVMPQGTGQPVMTASDGGSQNRQNDGGETVLVDKASSGSKAPGILAVSSMLMFSVSGYLFYDHLKDQGFQTEMVSNVTPVTQQVAQNQVDQNSSGLVGEKKLVQWIYNGQKKQNVARLAERKDIETTTAAAGYADVASNTEIIEVNGNKDIAPIVTASLGNRDVVDLSGADVLKKSRQGRFEKPSVLVGATSLRNAASRGVASAMFEVARRYQNGKGVKQDYKASAIWYRRAAEKNYAPAQYRLGTLYERGRGVEKNIALARDWYRHSAKLGNVKAMHNLGVIFSGQKELAPDYEQATEWFTKAAEHGLADSQFNLAIINFNGLGKTKDISEAYKWFDLAAKNGDKSAKEQKEILSKKMKIKDIMDARKKVKGWKNKKISRQANINLDKKYSWQDYAEAN